MSKLAESACLAAAIEVLETMFFEIPLDEPEPGGHAARASVMAKAVFNGGLRGSLSVACEPWAARRLAASFLGREDETTIEESEVRLIACELANMICGNALSRLEPHALFQIETPPATEEDAEAKGWLAFALETGSMAVRLRVEAP